MSQSQLKHRARMLVCAVLLAGGLGAAASASASAATSSSFAACANADVALSAVNSRIVRAAVLCLINVERAQRGLAPVRGNRKLRRAARRHSADMVRAGYFAHTAPNGDTFVDRVLATGYVARDDGWMLGENLAWGIGDRGTPRGVHEAWMQSRGHRAVILKRAYREIGIGIQLGVPTNAGIGATFTTEFGVKT